jgi:hypothetical protein
MDRVLLDQLTAAQRAIEPQFRALSATAGALKSAIKLASDERVEALAMQKALTKLRQAAVDVPSYDVELALVAFDEATRQALDALAFEFARELKAALEARGFSVDGRPPALIVDPLVLQLDVGGRQAQWFYGKEALTRPLPLSVSALLKAHEQQRKLIAERQLDVTAFLDELQAAWRKLVDGRARRPVGGRVNLVEVYSQVVMERQSARFWNAPSRATFRDYERPLFVRDLVLARAAPGLTVDGQGRQLRLGTATKSQADNAGRSIWLPSSALDGEYYADLTFEGE